MTENTQKQNLMRRMMTFHRANNEAMTYCDKGVTDYLSARCLLQDGLPAAGVTLSAAKQLQK